MLGRENRGYLRIIAKLVKRWKINILQSPYAETVATEEVI
jgi:hypothetical protein